jgi:hypothetical protein
MQKQFRLRIVRVLINMIDPRSIERARPADNPVYFVPMRQQQLRQVRPILPRDSRYQRAFTHTAWLPLADDYYS